MSDHDPLCPMVNFDQYPICVCGVIAKARADEDEKIAVAIEAAKTNMVEAESWFVLGLAARIARNWQLLEESSSEAGEGG